MESTVPYSLSDIQLPDSPSKIVKPAVKASSKKETLPPPPTNDSDKESQSDSDMHKNGLNSGSLSQTKSLLDDASNKKKISIMESKRSDSQKQVSKGSLKISDNVAEPENSQKSNQLKNRKNFDSEEKISKKVEEKSLKSKNKQPESQSSSSSSEDSSDSKSDRRKKQEKSKISGKHSKISKHRSRSSSSSSASSSQSQERNPEKLSKDSANNKKLSELHASRIAKHQAESFNPKTSKSKHHASSSSSSESSQSREASPVELSKKDVKKSVLSDVSKSSKALGEKTSDPKASKSRSRSPPSSRIQKSLKQSKEDTKQSVILDVSKDVRKHHSKTSSDNKSSRSHSRSPSESRRSRSKEKSPVKSSKHGKNVSVPDSPRIPREHRTSSSDKKSSKSRSRSPTSRQSSKSRKKSPLKQSKEDLTKQDLSEPSSISRKRNISDSHQKKSKSRSLSPISRQNSKSSERSFSKPSKKDDIFDKNTSKDRSRSPSKHQSRRSPIKADKEDAKKTSMRETSRKIQKDSAIEKNTSKSRSRSPSSSQSRERSPPKTSKASKTRKLSRSRSGSPSSSRSSQSPQKSPQKLLKEEVEKTSLSDASRTSRKRQTSSSDQKVSKSRSRSSSSSSPPPHHTLELFLSKKQRVAKASKEIAKSVKIDVSEPKSDPPRKKLKINRNNVVISSFGPSEKISVDEQKKLSNKSSVEKTKVVPSSPKKEQRESITLAQPEVEPEMGEIIENSPEVKYEPRKINFPGRKLSRKSSEDQTSSEPKSKKSKWGKFASSQKSSQAINISTDSLKNWFPEFKLVSEPSVVNDSMPEESPPIKEEIKLTFPVKIEEEQVKQTSTNDSHQIKEEPTLGMTDSNCPVSKIVFIQNLVRPFTLLQLKELLRQTGSFIEEDFWIDKIKSKCFVTYATEEEAVKTRNALNGVRWPSSNPKILIAEFSTEEEFEHHRSGKDTQKPTLERLPEVQETYEEKTPQSVDDHRRKDRDSDKRKERDRYRMQAPVREWDKDKVLQDSPEREKQDKNIEGFRGSDKKDKKDTKKRTNEDTPAKLLDDLFQKTKSAPCIYWLPLTEAQVLEHEESKRIRRLEREKRNQQREKEESEQRNKRSRPDHRAREMEHRRSSTRSRSPTSRRR